MWFLRGFHFSGKRVCQAGSQARLKQGAFFRVGFECSAQELGGGSNQEPTCKPDTWGIQLPKSPRVNPTRGASNCPRAPHFILSVILRRYSHRDSVGENPMAPGPPSHVSC